MSKEMEEVLEQIGRGVEEIKTETKSGLETAGKRLDRIEARLNRGGLEASGASRKTFGDSVLETPAMKGLLDGSRKLASRDSARIDVPGLSVKTLTNVGLGANSPATEYPTDPQRASGIYGHPLRPLRLLDFLTKIPATSSSFEFVQKQAWTNNADYQAGEGITKSESSRNLRLVRANISTIAHYERASKQVLDDAPMLKQFLDATLLHAVLAKLETELLTGDGQGSNEITGFLTQAPAASVSATSTADKISEQITDIEVADYVPNGIVMHPDQWHNIRIAKAAGGNEQYLSGNYTNPAPKSLWGLPVITTRSITSTKILVGDFTQCALLDREGASIEVSRDDSDNFTKNLVTILAELRAGLAIFDTTAFSVLTVS